MKKLNLLCGCVFFLLLFACAPKSDRVAAPEQTTMAEKNELPEVTLIEEDGRQFSATTLSGNTILIFFGAECDHCQREAADIQNNLAGFGQYTLYFVSMDAFPVIRKFAETYKIDKQPNIKFVRADGNTVFKSLGAVTTPTICIYNKARKLSRRFDGETKVQEIFKFL